VADKYDLIIIGAGPGGYVAAIRAAQLGMKTALIDKRARLGGTCLNIGCIPSKALLDSSEHYFRTTGELEEHGISVGEVKLDLQKMMARKASVVETLTSGVATLMKQHKIDVYHGTGTVKEAGTVVVEAAEGGDSSELNGDSIILATGSVPQDLPPVPFDGDRIVSSEEALSFDEVPKELLVVGAGAIGLEMGSVWARLGAKVTVIEILDSVLPGWDKQVARTLQRSLKALGMELATSTKVTESKAEKKRVVLKATDRKGAETSFEGDRVLVAVGRKPFISQDLEALGVKTDRGRVVVNERFETTIEGLYAIGDLVDGPMLAHKAEEDGVACVEGLAGLPVHVDYELVPNVVYTWPEAASVGKSEEALKEAGVEYTKGSFPFRANGRALAANDADGFVKILAEPDTDRILGAHILGPWASTLIAEIVAVSALGGNAEDIGRIVHAHPTLPEAVKEAGLSALGRAIHTA